MNNDLKHFEEELRRLIPRSPAPGLRHRIAEQLQDDVEAWWLWRVPAWGWAAAAALLVAGFVMFHIRVPVGERDAGSELAMTEETNAAPSEIPATDAAPPRHIRIARSERTPIAMGSVLVAEDRTLPILVSNNVPFRPVRRHYVDHLHWEDCDEGVHYSVTVPRQEIILVGLEPH